jgi:hypothetical protein
MGIRVPASLRALDRRDPPQGTIKLPAPYADWQHLLIHSPALLQVYALGTKTGKTLGLSTRLQKCSYVTSPSRPGYFRILAPYYRHTRITYKYMGRMMPEKPKYDVRLTPEQNAQSQEQWALMRPDRAEGKKTFEWRHNDAQIECMHGQDPAAIEGEAVDGQGIDEAAKFKEASFAAAMSTTTQRGGWTILTSTPTGKNWFYKVAMEAAEKEAWALKKGIPPEAIFRTVPTWTSPFVKAEVIENARRTMATRLFRGLYGGEFVDDGSVFTELDRAFNHATEFHLPTPETWVADRHESRSAFVGVDWAKNIDYTVFYAINEHGKNIGIHRMQKAKYGEQIKDLWAFCDKLRVTATRDGEPSQKLEVNILHDQTGVGEAVADAIDDSLEHDKPEEVKDEAAVRDFENAAKARNFTIHGIKWTNPLKEEYVNSAILSLEEGSVKLWPWDTLKKELSAFQVETSRAGNPIYGAPGGQHDDAAMAFIMANYLFRENRDTQNGSIILVDSVAREVEFIYYNMGDLDDFD